MMYLIYFLFVFASFLTSLFTFKYHRSFQLFPWLLGSTVVVEAVAGILNHVFIINPYPIYHFSMPLLAIVTLVFFYQNITERVFKKILLIALAVFALTSLCLTFFFYKLTEFPGLIMNMSGALLIGCSLYVLLTLDPIYHIPIYKHPLAWICIGIIIFYSGTFFLNGLYNYLVVSHSQNRLLIHAIINNGLNCIMYSCFSIGLLFSHRLKKYATSLR